jgi:DNA-binding transcriptional regulator YhcF (GntR family)
MDGEETERQLRYLIVGLLHVGRVRRGDPLPSIRGVARDFGADHRAVAAAYRVLEAEGLVEIRPGSGVYLAGDASAADTERSATARWLGEVMLEGWNRRVSRRELAALVERCAAARVRCALVESNDDHMLAVAAELEADFSLDVDPVRVAPDAGADAVPAAALSAADVVVTTVFHAAAVRAAAARAGKPFALLTLNPAFAAEVSRRLAGRSVTGVVADPRYIERGAAHLEVTTHRGQVSFVTVAELEATVRVVDFESDDVLVTRAARRRLGLPEYHLVPSPPPYISPRSAGELFTLLAGLGLPQPGPGGR